MRKTLYSILPLVVFFAPALSRLPIAPSFKSSDATTAIAAPLSAESAYVNRLRTRVAEAREALGARSVSTTEAVRLAVEDESSSAIRFLDLPKADFLKQDGEFLINSTDGEPLKLRVVRSNYVNTAVRVSDAAGRELQPLVVQYPIEKNGALSEVAYYTSAHPAAHSPELVRAGSDYVHDMLNEAARRLRARGKKISPEIIDVAERLCVVEHTDHKRFKTEDRGSLYDEIFTLYALNGGDTYRYSVSSAGAGGMVQMIPPTYQSMRKLHPNVDLHEDFVTGMRDHANALEVMLLYVQDTWNDLLKKEQIRSALANGVATREELLAAGYNSNPARLHKYIERGGHNWRTLIPQETQMYLRIYASVESLVQFRERS